MDTRAKEVTEAAQANVTKTAAKELTAVETEVQAVGVTPAVEEMAAEEEVVETAETVEAAAETVEATAETAEVEAAAAAEAAVAEAAGARHQEWQMASPGCTACF